MNERMSTESNSKIGSGRRSGLYVVTQSYSLLCPNHLFLLAPHSTLHCIRTGENLMSLRLIHTSRSVAPQALSGSRTSVLVPL